MNVFIFYIIYQQNKGRACARNEGIKNAKNEIIIFTDDDLILSNGYIQRHIECHEDGEKVAHGKIYNLPRTKFFKDPIEGTFIEGISVRPKVKEGLFPSMHF